MMLQRAAPRRRIAVSVVLVALALWLAHAAGQDAGRPSATERPPALDDLELRTVTEMGSREGDELREWLVAGAPPAVVRGAVAYDENCAVCHGDTGLGYEEARFSFPADHRNCTRCHRPGNEREMSFETMMQRQHNLFDVGDPPALRGPGALSAFAVDEVLFAYTRATMPRYQPGRLDDEDYADLVAFMRWVASPP
jgi:mono/diheme cytochrome c family protein